MSFKRSVLSLALSVTMLAWATGHAFASPVLIRLELKSEAEYENARKLNVQAFHRIDDLFIAQFEESDLSALQDEGLTYQIIDREPWTEGYYLISESKKFEQVNFSHYGRVLVETENSYFMKISDQGARSLAAKGYYIVKVFPHAIPLKYKPAPEGVPKSSAADPSIDSLLSLISEDSLYTWTLRMQEFQTRYSYTDSIHAARQWIFDKFSSFGIDSVWFQHYFDDSHQYNVVATVPGTVQPDKVIVVGGHYDSVVYGAGTDPYTWAPGADDNATGTVATLEIARIISENPLPVTVMFVPFPQEEQGLIGSWYFCQWLYYHYVDVYLMLNADMIAHSVDSYQNATIYAHSSAMDFVNIMIDMGNTYTYLHPAYGGQSSGSDHYSFYEWGWDALFAAEGDFFYGGWHKNYDIVDSLDFDYMTEVVKMEMATLITVARSFGPNYLIGDANADDVIDAGDVVFLLNYLFLAGSAPYPMLRGDLDCSGEVNVADLIFLINYLYLEGPEPPASC